VPSAGSKQGETNMMRKILFAAALLSICAVAQGARDELFPEPVAARDGHFYVGGKRLRLWGVNLGHWHCRDYRGADLTIKRIKDMGFNAIALWVSRGAFQQPKGPAHAFRAPKKGDGSAGDLFDYVVYRARREKLYIVHTFMQRVFPQFITEADYDLVPGGSSAERAEWLKAVKSLKRNFGCAKFIDERIRELYFRKAKWMLNRVNPYTGLRYAEDNSVAFYEQADEEGFIVKTFWARGWRDTYWGKSVRRKYNDYLRGKYGGDEQLVAKWGKLDKGESLAKGTVEVFGPGMRLKSFSPARWEDTNKFLYDLTREFHLSFQKMLRAQAPKGQGINVQPIAVDSVIYTKPAGIYTALSGSFMCGTAEVFGGGQLVKNGKSWKWTHWTQRPLKARVLQLDAMAYAPLAGAVKRPDPFRALNPAARSIYSSWQDQDGVFFYWWGYFDKGVPYTNENFPRQPLTYGTPEKRKGGFEILADEVLLSAARAAGAAYLAGNIAPAETPTKFVFGHDLLFGPKAFDYADKLWPEIAATAFARGARLKLDPEGPGLLRAEGPVVKKLPGQRLKAGPEITYDFKKGFVKVDAKRAKIFGGNAEKVVLFSDGVELRGATRPFVVFILTARDGKPIASSHDMTASLVSTSDNTGFKFNAGKVTVHPRFKFPQPHTGVVSTGAAPVVVKRVGAQIVLPRLPGRRCKKIDFKMSVFAETAADEGVTVKQTEPVFALEFYVK